MPFSTSRSTSTSAIATLVVTIMLAALVFVASPAQAQAQSTRDYAMEAGFLSSLNQQRAARGVAPLTLNSSMSSAAAGWTSQMVSGTFLAHAPDIKPGVPAGWNKIGENVGRGKSVSSLTQSFMASPGHARNVLDDSFTHVGIAVIVHPNGRVYTTHRFAALGAQPAQPVAPPAQPVAPPVQPVASPAQPVASPTQPVAEPRSVLPPAPAPQPRPTLVPEPTPEAASARINVAATAIWDDIDQIRAAAARKLAVERGTRQPSTRR